MTDNQLPVRTETERATPRPWHAHSQPQKIDSGRWGGDFWWIESEGEHDIADVGQEADAALIVEAVNNYDRLRAIEAAARGVLPEVMEKELGSVIAEQDVREAVRIIQAKGERWADLRAALEGPSA